MTDDKGKSLDEWIAEERSRLDKGFSYQPQPTSGASSSSDDILTGLGIGAGAAAGILGPHTNPVTYEGVRASVIANALQQELNGNDIRVQVRPNGQSTSVTFLHSPDRTYQFVPALSVTLLEGAGTLTVTMSALNQDVKRETISSIGGTLARQGLRVLSGRLINAAGNIIASVSDIVENIQDLNLPNQVWEIIDRVAGAAEETHFESQRRANAAQRQRQAAEHAWTHCPSCGRAYRPDETDRVDCPSCGGVRGPKPEWLD